MWLTLTTLDNKKIYLNMNLVYQIQPGKLGAELVVSGAAEPGSKIQVKEAATEVADRLTRAGIKVG
jgi:hypothetical protein